MKLPRWSCTCLATAVLLVPAPPTPANHAEDATAAPVAAGGQPHGDKPATDARPSLVIVVQTVNSNGAKVPVAGADVIVFVKGSEELLKTTNNDGKALFPMKGEIESATVRVVAKHLQVQQTPIPLQSLQAHQHTVVLEKDNQSPAER